MLKSALGVLALIAQLSGLGSSLPQVLKPDFKTDIVPKVGKPAEVTVAFELLKGYAINHTPPISLKLTAVPNVALAKLNFETPSEDPKSKDEYYVDLPSIKVPVTAAKAGKYEIPGKLTYYFCSKTDGFCSRQVLDVKIPLIVQ